MKQLVQIVAVTLALISVSETSSAQNVGINRTAPLASLDVRGTQRVGGINSYIRHDSATGRIEWINSNLYVPVTQSLMKHSAAGDGLYYNNSNGVNGQLEYRNAAGIPVFFTNFVNGNGYFSNMLGIGNLNPQFPLTFNANLGDKISLWTDGTSTHYGMGIQSSLFQIFSKTSFDDIALGYGSSYSFSERMRIKNAGENGLELNGRIVLRNGTSPLDINYGPGVWLNNADNTALLGFMGTQNNQNIGFYGGPAGWGFTYDAVNSRVGIGNSTPNAPLSFPPQLGKKITLYPGATGDVGMSVQGNLLQIYSDNPNADIAFGYDQAGVMTEKFRIRSTGALMVNGNSGNSGQWLQSNGSGAAPVWTDPSAFKTKYYQANIPSTVLTAASSTLNVDIPVTVSANSVITVSVTANVATGNFGGCFYGELSITLQPVGGGALIASMGKFDTPCGRPIHTISTGEISLLNISGGMLVFGPGSQTIRVSFVRIGASPDLTIGNSEPAKILVKITPQ